ncbi:MAG: DUF4198 domain-containing protein [Thermoguttaceae bacterium]|nr:DUF4198 domain-containing protein [Thermoguttaceae bacterium]MDW8079515.1 hypothetical protein [Thermoguttaceae bacterium]
MLINTTRRLSTILVALGGLLAAGCGERAGGDIPPTAPVSGVVLLDGKPVDGAMVVFAPVEGGRYGAYAMTDSNGRFELKASEDVKGAVPGKYRVQVTKLVAEGGGSKFLVQEDLEHALKAGGAPQPGQEGQTKNVLPEKYASPETSGIEVTVPKEGITNLEIKLSSS